MKKQTSEERAFELELFKEINEMSTEELLTFIPKNVLQLIAAGFLAGMRGPKKYQKNNWQERSYKSTADILPSLLGHIAQAEKRALDPETGISRPEIFVGARVIMYLYAKSKEFINDSWGKHG